MLLLVSKPSGNCFFTFGESNTIGLGSLSVQVILTPVKCLVILHEVFIKYSRTIHEVTS